nr:transcription initiation factor IIA large subunit-like [Ipomoea batatas]
MASSNTSNVYIHVIEDVINKVRDEFINNGGPGESVLNELQGIWEMKMMQAGAILGPIERNSAPKAVPGGPITPVHDLNVPYEGSEEYETPTADLLFPPTPLPTPAPTPMPGTAQTPLPGTAHTPTVDLLFPPTPLPTPAPTPLPGTAQTPLPGTAQTPPGTADSSLYNIPTGGTPITPNEYSTVNENDIPDVKPAQGRPSPYMQPPSTWMNQRPPLDVNVAYVEGREDSERVASQQPPLTQDFFMVPPSGKRKRDFASQYQPGGYIPQQDGAGDALYYDPKSVQGSAIQHGSVAAGKEIVIEGLSISRIPQLDGPIPDPYDEMLSTPNIYNYQGAVNEDYNVANTPAPDMQAPTPAPVPQNDAVDDDDEEPLNENDDDDLDDVDQGEDLNTAHLVLAQFDKVTRTKSRWKCTLKDGIMHINNKDILFNKATGEFDF